jgi:hypothetical protein
VQRHEAVCALGGESGVGSERNHTGATSVSSASVDSRSEDSEPPAPPELPCNRKLALESEKQTRADPAASLWYTRLCHGSKARSRVSADRVVYRVASNVKHHSRHARISHRDIVGMVGCVISVVIGN